MARFDPTTGEIVVRIVYDGPATAGKTTNLEKLHSAFSSRAPSGLLAPERTPSGRTLHFDWLDLEVGHLDSVPLRAQLISVPGQLVYARRRYRLLQGVDAAVFVCESTPVGIAAGKVAWAFFAKLFELPEPESLVAMPFVLQANKQDLAEAVSPESVATALGVTPDACVGASARDGEGVRETLLRALNLVRGRVRLLLADSSPEDLPRAHETPEELSDSLRNIDSEPPPAMYESALEAALDRVKMHEE